MIDKPEKYLTTMYKIEQIIIFEFKSQRMTQRPQNVFLMKNPNIAQLIYNISS